MPSSSVYESVVSVVIVAPCCSSSVQFLYIYIYIYIYLLWVIRRNKKKEDMTEEHEGLESEVIVVFSFS